MAQWGADHNIQMFLAWLILDDLVLATDSNTSSLYVRDLDLYTVKVNEEVLESV